MAELADKIFNEEMNAPVVHETLRWFLAQQRSGTHSAKTRSEVHGGGVKPWKQKGTGRARAGSTRSPLWRKGGVIFPPKPRDYSYRLPKKVRKLAVRVVLSQRWGESRVKIVDSFSLPQSKTREGMKFLKDAGVSGKVLMVAAAKAPEFDRAVRNIPGVTVVLANSLNIFDLLQSEWLVMEKGAVDQLAARLI
ncbi:50S ribosomal protein L4 [Candidatus Saganbacteria bacterium]|uniref:Large ribosomal subunit protein uL4 n=1 Tax=Candidatus Saganbacteria bacterium TaxID=2575572 RepID=A0A9D6YT61_UNCSA|nr:50S ribosomal protein L4 [Candidatus Saganbacteria bacterium]